MTRIPAGRSRPLGRSEGLHPLSYETFDMADNGNPCHEPCVPPAGAGYRQTEEYHGAIADLAKAIRFDPIAGPYQIRAMAFRALGAEVDISRAEGGALEAPA